MIDSDPFVAVIVAAGKGERFGGETPKQYQKIREKTLLEISTEIFLEQDLCRGVCIVINKDCSMWKSLYLASHPKVFFIEGGDSRMDSSLNGIRFWLKHKLEFLNILIHDAVRPCLSKVDLVNLLKEFSSVKENNSIDGMILATPCSSTIKSVQDDTNLINKTVNRESLWFALTPQIFTKNILSKILELQKEFSINYTDESSLVESLGGVIKIFEGSSDNIKVTKTSDLVLAEAIISLRIK